MFRLIQAILLSYCHSSLLSRIQMVPHRGPQLQHAVLVLNRPLAMQRHCLCPWGRSPPRVLIPLQTSLTGWLVHAEWRDADNWCVVASSDNDLLILCKGAHIPLFITSLVNSAPAWVQGHSKWPWKSLFTYRSLELVILEIKCTIKHLLMCLTLNRITHIKVREI